MIDPRGARFVALSTAIVLAVVLLTGNAWVLAFQAAIFAIGALFGLKASPYSLAFRRLVRPRIGPPATLEDAAPPRFAQSVGLGFAVVGLAGLALDVPIVAYVAVGAAFAAAFLNAAFGFCLGCEVYVLLHRGARRADSPGSSPSAQEVSA